MERLQIRPATLDDAADIARVHLGSWRESYADWLPSEVLASLDVDARRQMWASVLLNDNPPSAASVFVVEQVGRISGFLACSEQRSAELAAYGFDGEIGAIYILNEAQGRGAGRQLMAAGARALTARRKIGVSLWVLAENRKARAFYERLEGRMVGKRSEQTAQAMLTEVAYGWSDLALLTI